MQLSSSLLWKWQSYWSELQTLFKKPGKNLQLSVILKTCIICVRDTLNSLSAAEILASYANRGIPCLLRSVGGECESPERVQVWSKEEDAP